MRSPWISRTLEIQKIVIIQTIFLHIFLQTCNNTKRSQYKLPSIAVTAHNFVVKDAFDSAFKINIELIALNV